MNFRDPETKKIFSACEFCAFVAKQQGLYELNLHMQAVHPEWFYALLAGKTPASMIGRFCKIQGK